MKKEKNQNQPINYRVRVHKEDMVSELKLVIGDERDGSEDQ